MGYFGTQRDRILSTLENVELLEIAETIFLYAFFIPSQRTQVHNGISVFIKSWVVSGGQHRIRDRISNDRAHQYVSSCFSEFVFISRYFCARLDE